MNQPKNLHNSRPLVLIAGSPHWASDVQAALGEDYHIEQHHTRRAYMQKLVEAQPALVLIDGRHPQWAFWTTTARASPATRRIPLLLVTDDAAQQADAARHGADTTLPPAHLAAELPRLVKELARIPDEGTQQQLIDECAQPLPPLALEGIRQFNAGEYYRQHDLFEELWVETEGPVRDLYRAILQVGVAYYQIERGNYNGALKMLQRSVQWLAAMPDRCQGVDVAALREDAGRVYAELQRLGPQRLHELDRALLRPVRCEEDA